MIVAVRILRMLIANNSSLCIRIEYERLFWFESVTLSVVCMYRMAVGGSLTAPHLGERREKQP